MFRMLGSHHLTAKVADNVGMAERFEGVHFLKGKEGVGEGRERGKEEGRRSQGRQPVNMWDSGHDRSKITAQAQLTTLQCNT